MRDLIGLTGLIEVIEEDQRADGSFASYSVPLESAPPGKRFGAAATEYRTTFMVALIAEALAEVADPRLEAVRQRAVDWLLEQRGPQWSYNYWARDAAEAKTQPYPDDWDDTSCTLAAVMRVRPAAVTGEVMGHIVTLLTNTETAEGGPYRTWIVPQDAPAHWHDVDVAVNANIGYMLKLQGVDLPSLEQLVDERVAAGVLESPYYPGPGTIEYFVSRWYRGAHGPALRTQILARRRAGRWGGALDTALAVSALINLGADPSEVQSAATWLRGRRADQLAAEAFCMDPAIEGVKYVAGSRALTAALCLEALAKYEAAVQARAAGRAGVRRAGAGPAGAGAGPTADAGGSAGIREQVVARVMTRLAEGGPEIAAGGQQIWGRLSDGPAAEQIILLPYLFRQALGKRGRAVSDDRVVELGVISLYGWLAYTIYDDFLDEEGQPPLLPVANLALRELVLALQREAARRPAFGPLAWATLDQQEAANAWEVTHCRVRRQSDLLRRPAPDFGDRRALAERSLGHALGCLAITLELGYRADGPEVAALQRFFRQFLTARQLSDDVHDWKQDLTRGQINAVGAYLLAGIQGGAEAQGAKAPRPRTVPGLYEQLDRYFWERGAAELGGQIEAGLGRARAAVKGLAWLERPEVLEALLAPIEQSARRAEQQRRQATEFLRSYQPGQ